MQEINYNKLSVADKEGRVFELNRTIYRGIYNKESEILDFLNTDLYKALSSKGYIPLTKMSDLKVDGFTHVLEHETASYVNYPHEWSFEMFKDACILMLKIELVCREFGYGIKDGHPFNMVFFNGIPKFVDIGSFVKRDPNNNFFIEEFKQRAFLPLLIWSEKHYGLAFLIIRDCSAHHSKHELIDIYRGLILVKNLGLKTISNYLNARKNIFPLFDTQDINYLKSSIETLELNKYKSTWVNYHSSLYKNGQVISTPRFDKIISVINDLNITSLCDVACNEGVLSILVNERCKNVKQIVSIDFDENAIDNFYKIIKKDNKLSNITVLVNNIVAPSHNYFEELPEVRYKSDCVVALALTHHILIGQNYHIDVVFKKFAALTKRYLIIEFMPLGLWGGEGHEKPLLPDFYNEDWFATNLSKEFKIINKLNLEVNRTCFVCEKP